ncbi:MAG: SIS domain-containing protein [Spirochaetaceae bacterium]|jgi:D-sedoheptulose 7-phosphate isomerase|nr:SIS domain-containing protein [Spirochaetaceae bacterium]
MDYLRQLINRYPVLVPLEGDVRAAYGLLEGAFSSGGKLLAAGNGGSSADADHIVGELGKGFVKKRPALPDFQAALCALDSDTGALLAANLECGLPALALHAHTALATATANDRGAEFVYAQQVYCYGAAGDVFLGISTSGNARNVYLAAVTAKAVGMKIIALTGGTGGKLGKIADTAVIVPENETFKIQELHLPVYHALCLALEERFFST